MKNQRLHINRKATVFAPASVANVACGFDILGFAIEKPGDIVRAVISKNIGVRIVSIQGDEGVLPTDVLKNTAGVAALRTLEHIQTMYGEEFGVDIHIKKNMPSGSGLGSSAASAVAASVAINALFDNPIVAEDLVHFAMKGEAIASGAEHADNVAPSLLGGITLIRGYHPLDIIRIHVPSDLIAVVVNPHVIVKTKEARAILPKKISLHDAITQTGNIAGLIAGCMREDYGLIGRSLIDVIAEPHRARLIPCYDAMKTAAMQAGALGFNISGSGPSVFALTQSLSKAKAIARAIVHTLKREGVTSSTYISPINTVGPKVQIV